MALETSRLRLVRHLHDAAEKLAGLETIVGDHPDEETPALVDRLSEVVLDAHGRVEDALSEARQLVSDETGKPLVEIARTALPSIHHAMHRAIFDCLLNLAAPTNSAELARIARLRGGEWTAWVGVIRPALADSVRVLEAAHATIGDCWSDLFEQPATFTGGIRQIVNICHRDSSLTPANFEPITIKS
jgi:hypothetical protein